MHGYNEDGINQLCTVVIKYSFDWVIRLANFGTQDLKFTFELVNVHVHPLKTSN